MPGARSADPAEAARAQAANAASDTGEQANVHQEDVRLPPGFFERARLIPGATLQVHLPVALRVRLARVWAQTLEGMAADLPGYTRLEEVRSRLLTATPPPGMHVESELAARLALWEVGQWGELLARLEAQALLAQQRSTWQITRRQIHSPALVSD